MVADGSRGPVRRRRVVLVLALQQALGESGGFGRSAFVRMTRGPWFKSEGRFSYDSALWFPRIPNRPSDLVDPDRLYLMNICCFHVFSLQILFICQTAYSVHHLPNKEERP